MSSKTKILALVHQIEECYEHGRGPEAHLVANKELRDYLDEMEQNHTAQHIGMVEPVRLTAEQIEALWRDEWDGFVSFEEACVVARAIESAVLKANGIGGE
jgi:hypothetical protein